MEVSQTANDLSRVTQLPSKELQKQPLPGGRASTSNLHPAFGTPRKESYREGKFRVGPQGMSPGGGEAGKER